MVTDRARSRQGWVRWAAVAALASSLAAPSPATAPARHLRVVGGLADVNQYTRHEEPFWTRELPRLSGGSASAEIVPFDRAGLRGQDLLRLIGLGVVPFGTALLSQSVGTVPLAAAADLAGQNPDIDALRRSVAAFRPFLEKTLREQHGVEVLAVYAYPAQVVFCAKPFAGLASLAGRRVRVGNPSQADFVQALGATPVSAAFAEIVPNLKSGNVDCAITGTMSGNTIGLHELTTHVHAMALNWGLAVFGANASVWQSLSPELQALLKRELPRLEAAIWRESERETGDGLRCNAGDAACVGGRKGRMVVVPASLDDQRLRRTIFADTVLPRWLRRCGTDCADVWNRTVGAALGIEARTP